MSGKLRWGAALLIGAVVALLCPNPLRWIGDSLGEHGGARFSAEVIGTDASEGDLDSYFWLWASGFRGAHVERTVPGRYQIAIAGIDQQSAQALAVQASDSSGLEFREEIVEPEEARLFYRSVARRPDLARRLGIEADIESWFHDRSRGEASQPILRATSADALREFIDAVLADSSLQLSTQILFERVAPHYRGSSEPAHWRTRYLSKEVALVNFDVAHVSRSWDEMTGRPQVMVRFTQRGTKRFSELSSRAIGRRVAIVVNGEVMSLPVVQERIDGGEARISLGAGNPDELERQADSLVRAIRYAAPPTAVQIELVEMVSPSRWALVLRVLIGILVAFACAFLGGATRPATSFRFQRSETRGAPWKAALATLFTVAAVVLASMIGLPGVDIDEVKSFLAMSGPSAMTDLSVIRAGLGPLFAGMVAAELFFLLTPRGRRARRGTPHDRRFLLALGLTLGILCTALLGWSLSMHLRGIQGAFGLGRILANPGTLGTLTIVLSIAAGSVALLALGWFLRERVLGGGVAVVFLATGLTWLTSPTSALDILVFQGGHTVPLIACGLAAGVSAWFVGRKVDGLRAPCTGVAPLEWTMALAAVLALADGFGVRLELVSALAESQLFLVIAAFLLAGLFAVAFSRQVNVSPRALGRPWLASVLYLVAIYAAIRAAGPAIGVTGVIFACVMGAYLRDAIVDFRARANRDDWSPVWIGHDVHKADELARSYGEAGTPYFLRGIHVRALFYFFAPYFPITLYVPRESAPDEVDPDIPQARVVAGA